MVVMIAIMALRWSMVEVAEEWLTIDEAGSMEILIKWWKSLVFSVSQN